MKENIIIRGLGLVAIIGAIILTAFLLVQMPQRAQGSVSVSNEYFATTTDSNWNSKQCKSDMASTTRNATLGSVVVTLGSNAPLYIYDATTTGPHSDHATTTIAAFKTTATAGTYTFDVKVLRGICVVAGESTVGVASTTITTRP